VEMDDRQRREFHEALLDAVTFEDPELRRQPPRLLTRARGRSAARPCAASAPRARSFRDASRASFLLPLAAALQGELVLPLARSRG
jgi:hypothetical protein